MTNGEPEIDIIDPLSEHEIDSVVSILNKPVEEAVPALSMKGESLWSFIERMMYSAINDEFIAKKLGILKPIVKWALGLLLKKIREEATD